MTIELVDGKAGTAHISSEDKAIIHQAKFSKSDVVFDWGDAFKCSMSSSNRATIGTGCASIQGLDWHITAAESVTISNGSQGMKRNDIICAHYHRNSSDGAEAGIESVELTVLKGTPNAAAAADPTIPSGKILSGAADAYMPLWRIPLDGITVGTPVRLFTPREALWDSVTRSAAIIGTGTPNIVRYCIAGAVVFVSGYLMVSSGEWVGFASGLPGPPFEVYSHAASNTNGSIPSELVKLRISADGTLSARYGDSVGHGKHGVDFSIAYVAG